MSARVFLDTNILVYAIESQGPTPAKTVAAQGCVRRTDVCLSTQVLGEFYRAVTHPRRAQPLKHDEAVAWVQLWKRHDVRSITLAHVDLALEITARYQVSYFDALILSAARLAGCTTVLSEDLHSAQDYGGIRVENPLPA
jgi:predicted nucleic acid-binding protein